MANLTMNNTGSYALRVDWQKDLGEGYDRTYLPETHLTVQDGGRTYHLYRRLGMPGVRFYHAEEEYTAEELEPHFPGMVGYPAGLYRKDGNYRANTLEFTAKHLFSARDLLKWAHDIGDWRQAKTAQTERLLRSNFPELAQP